MASSEAGPSTSFTNSAAGVVVTGPGKVTTRDVIVHNYNSASQIDEFPLPALIDTFHGREDEMRELDEAFFSEQKNKVVICGLGGFGKTELSKQFGQQCLDNGKVQSVLWIESEDPKKLKESFRKLRPIYNQCAGEQLLVIFDNCVNQKSIADYEPSENQNHHILITSQCKQWRSDVKIIELQPLSSGPALQVFRSVLGDMYRVEDEHLYETLAHSVGCIPLGLQVVTSYVEQEDDDFNLAEYVQELKKSVDKIIIKPISDCADTSYEKTIYGAMITSIDKIKNKSDQESQVRELAHDVLCFCAYLTPDIIITEMLLPLINKKNNVHKDNEFKLALKLLLNFSFLRYGDDRKSYFVQHRTTQAFVRYYISESKLHVYYNLCLDLAYKDRNMTSTFLSHADSNVTMVHDFYKDIYMHENIGWFLQDLIWREAIGCIKTIFENADEQTKNHINKYDLLAECAFTENVEILKVLLSHVNINSKNDKQDTALHVFAKCKNLKGIKFLVRHGADVKVPNAAGDPPLFTFIRGNELIKPQDWQDVFKTLQPEADFSLTNSNKQTLLHAAATGQQPALIDFLIKNGLQVNQTDNNGWTPLDSLHHHISESFHAYNYSDNYVSILEKLLTLGATSNNFKHTTKLGDSYDYLSLYSAVKCNNLDLLELLLNRGVDVNSRSWYQRTILHACAMQKNLEASQLVIKHNADCYVRDRDGDTPLFYFVKFGRHVDNDMDLLKNMLDLLQCHPGHVGAAGDTVLHVATRERNGKLVEMLLTVYEFNVNIQKSNGDTPLHALISTLKDFLYYYDYIKEDIIKMIKMFKCYNARLDLTNKLEETPLDMLQRICTKEHIINDLRPYLIPAPASVNNRKRKLDS